MNNLYAILVLLLGASSATSHAHTLYPGIPQGHTTVPSVQSIVGWEYGNLLRQPLNDPYANQICRVEIRIVTQRSDGRWFVYRYLYEVNSGNHPNRHLICNGVLIPTQEDPEPAILAFESSIGTIEGRLVSTKELSKPANGLPYCQSWFGVWASARWGHWSNRTINCQLNTPPVSCVISSPGDINHGIVGVGDNRPSLATRAITIRCSGDARVTIYAPNGIELTSGGDAVRAALTVGENGGSTASVVAQPAAEVRLTSIVDTSRASPGGYAGTGLLIATWD